MGVQRATFVVVAAALGVILPACTNNHQRAERRPLLPLETQPPSDFYNQALTGGTLGFEGRGSLLCSYVGSTRVVWPAGFHTDDGRTLVDGGGKTVAVAGETIQVGGGGMTPPSTRACGGADWTWFASPEIPD
jgi:hypothetical protein